MKKKETKEVLKEVEEVLETPVVYIPKISPLTAELSTADGHILKDKINEIIKLIA